MDCSPPGSSVTGILQARILEWFAIPFFRGSSPPRDQTHVSYVSCILTTAPCVLISLPVNACIQKFENHQFHTVWNFCFHLITWNGDRIYLSSYLKKKKKRKDWTKCMKQWFSDIGHQAAQDVILGSGKQIKWSLQLFQLSMEREFLGERKRRDPRKGLLLSLNNGDGVESPGRPRCLGLS